MAYPSFDMSATNGATAVAFSPSASVLYIATTGETVVATNSAGTEDPIWSTAVPDNDLCDIVLSPDGLSVRTHQSKFIIAFGNRQQSIVAVSEATGVFVESAKDYII